MQSRVRNDSGSQPSQQMGAAELGSSSQRCACAVPRQKCLWLTAISGAAELGSSSQRCVCAVPRQEWHWLTAISTDGSYRTRFEFSEMCLCIPASEMTLAHSHLRGCRTRFELSEMCLCSPASEMTLTHSHLNRWELPN